ncbi:MAG: radical SAM protein [bacterium]|nr:radical SAM protein [bacterium]
MTAPEPGHPLCRVFRHGGRIYAYDAGADQVVELSPSVASWLEAAAPDPAVIDADPAISDEFGRAHAEHGLFCSRRPRLVAKRSGRDRAIDYSSRISQMTLTLDERCNLRCAYCPHTRAVAWTRPHGERRMSEETVRAAVDLFLTCAGGGSPSISLYGGEPLLAPGLVRMVADLVQAEQRPEIRIILDTNGTLLDDAMVELIAERGLYLQVSLDGPAPIHDRWRTTSDGRPTHATVMAGLARLLARDPAAAGRLRFQATLAPGSDLLEADAFFVKLGRNLGLADLSVGASYADLSWMVEADPAMTPSDADGWERARDAYVAACASGRHAALGPLVRAWFDGPLIRFYHREAVPLGATFRPGGVCTPGLRRLHVCSDGRLQPCERVGTAFVLGDVRRGFDLDAVDRLEQAWFDALGGRCADCWALRHCSLCFTAMIDRETGRVGAVQESACRAVREEFESTLRLWVELLARSPRALDHLKDSSVS